MEKKLFNNIQNFCGEIDEGACYSLCLLSAAEEYNLAHGGNSFDVLSILNQACNGTDKNAIIYFNRNNLFDNDNFYVQHPDVLLKMVTNRTWTVRKEYNLNYKPQKNEFIIKYYERIKTGSTTGHFERDNFKPIENSITVKYGKLHSLRVLKVFE